MKDDLKPIKKYILLNIAINIVVILIVLFIIVYGHLNYSIEELGPFFFVFHLLVLPPQIILLILDVINYKLVSNPRDNTVLLTTIITACHFIPLFWGNILCAFLLPGASLIIYRITQIKSVT